ncbi:universal stress protein [Fulvivirga sp.]|uniref:universal stress protein n=2 Tax=Fulvivirga sp. TaxID=1931237 RepID=UPI0032EDA8C8
MKNILVPTDFSELSENALKMAVDICRKKGSEIYLVNFTEHNFGDNYPTLGDTSGGSVGQDDVFQLQLVRKNHSRLSKLAEKHGASVKIHFQVYDEDFSDGYKLYIKEKNIDLVVMGTSGEESYEEFFSGNHALQVIEGATCPVITVKDTYTQSTFNNIIVGIDLESDRKDNYAQAATYLNEFAETVVGKLHLVHVAELNSDKDKVQKEVEQLAEKSGFRNYTLNINQNDNVEQGLLAYSYAVNADMLVILTHKEGGLFRLFKKSVAEDLSKKSSRPIMTINLHNI